MLSEKGFLFRRSDSTRFWIILRYIVVFASLFFAIRRLYVVNRQYNTIRHTPHRAAAGAYPPRRGYEVLQRDAWAKLADALEQSRPRLASTLHVNQVVPGKPIENYVEEAEPVDAIKLDFKTATSLKIRHARYVQAIKSSSIPMIFREHERGIVVTGTAKDLPAILVQLRLLRRTRSLLPVEVFLLTEDDYDIEICDKILPSLKARCRVLETMMSSAALPFVPDRNVRRQIIANEPLHKLLAVFFSDYQDILVLGHDTLVYNNPDVSFREEPYLSRGLVMWPDFWASSIWPRLHKIQGKQIPNTVDKSLTVDMGQMMISKAEAKEALMLAIYYTVYGPNLYDVLLKQSDVGEAGSQAIKVAARYLDMQFYIVKRQVEAVGYPDLDSAGHPFRGVAMLQTFPKEDFFRLSKDRQIPAFVRANNPALDPTKIMSQGVTSFASSGNATAHRMWEWFGARYQSNGWRDPDPEQAMWAEMGNVACTDLAKVGPYQVDSPALCKGITDHISQLGLRRDVLF